MSRTGHASTDGVRAYKHTSQKLKQLTSDVIVLNGANTSQVVKPQFSPPPAKPTVLNEFEPPPTKHTGFCRILATGKLWNNFHIWK